jgi:hypothetical protein
MTKSITLILLVAVVLAAGMWATGCAPKAEAPAAVTTTPPPETPPAALAATTPEAQPKTVATAPKAKPKATAAKPGVTPAAAVYVCPMDADVTSNKPGKCPKCGMALVKKP